MPAHGHASPRSASPTPFSTPRGSTPRAEALRETPHGESPRRFLAGHVGQIAQGDGTCTPPPRSGSPIPFSTPRGTPRAEALRETPRGESPPPSARRCFVCRQQIVDQQGLADVDDEHVAARCALQASEQPPRPPKELASGSAYERLATSKLRAELAWGAPPIADLKPSTRYLTSPSAQLVHRLEGVVWALEQRVVAQQRQILALRDAKARLAEQLADCRRGSRCEAEQAMLRSCLGEAEEWAGALKRRLDEIDAKTAAKAREAAEKASAAAAASRRNQGQQVKSNYEQQVERIQQKSDAQHAEQRRAKAAAADAAKAAKAERALGSWRGEGASAPTVVSTEAAAASGTDAASAGVDIGTSADSPATQHQHPNAPKAPNPIAEAAAEFEKRWADVRERRRASPRQSPSVSPRVQAAGSGASGGGSSPRGVAAHVPHFSPRASSGISPRAAAAQSPRGVAAHVPHISPRASSSISPRTAAAQSPRGGAAQGGGGGASSLGPARSSSLSHSSSACAARSAPGLGPGYSGQTPRGEPSSSTRASATASRVGAVSC